MSNSELPAAVLTMHRLTTHEAHDKQGPQFAEYVGLEFNLYRSFVHQFGIWIIQWIRLNTKDCYSTLKIKKMLSGHSGMKRTRTSTRAADEQTIQEDKRLWLCFVKVEVEKERTAAFFSHKGVFIFCCCGPIWSCFQVTVKTLYWKSYFL